MSSQHSKSTQSSPRRTSTSASSPPSRTIIPQDARLPPLRYSQTTQSPESSSRPSPIEPRSLPQPSYNLQAFHTTTPRTSNISSSGSSPMEPDRPRYSRGGYFQQAPTSQPTRQYSRGQRGTSFDASTSIAATSESLVQNPELVQSPVQSPSRRQGGEQQPSQANHGCRLVIRQQPEAARACGFGERDRRVIDPPPVLELEVLDPSARPNNPETSQFPMYIVHAELWNEVGDTNVTTFPQTPTKLAHRLIGQSVASPDEVYDHNNHRGYYFTFADLSCREMGRYRLCFRLLRITQPNMQVGASEPVLSTCFSSPFTVYSAKEFPGMQTSTPLTRALKDQGVNIPAKKGKARASTSRSDRNARHSEDEAD